MNLNNFICSLCKKILKQPIRLESCLCNELNICKEHFDDIKKNRDFFECPKCHFKYDDSFNLFSLSTLENKTLKNSIENFKYLSDQEFEIKFNFDKIFEQIKTECLAFNTKIDEFSLIQADYFESLRREIDIRRECLIQEIFDNLMEIDLVENKVYDHEKDNPVIKQLNEKSSEMIEKIELFEKEFRKNFDQNIKPNLIGFNLDEIETEMSELLRDTQDLAKNLKVKLDFYTIKLREMQQRLKNFKLYEYDLKKTKFIITEKFGELVLSNLFFNGINQEIFNIIINDPLASDEIKILNLNTGHIVKNFNIMELSIFTVNHDSSKLISIAKSSDCIKVWNLLTNELLHTFEHKRVLNVKCLANNILVSIPFSYGEIKIWDLLKGHCLITSKEYLNVIYLEQAITEKNILILGCEECGNISQVGVLRIWDLNEIPMSTSKQVEAYDEKDFTETIKEWPWPSKIVEFQKIQGMKMIDTARLRLINLKLIKSLKNSLFACIYFNKCRYMQTNTDQKTRSSLIDIWNYETRECVHILSKDGHTEPVNDLEYLENENRLISCSDDKTIRIWCMETFLCINIIKCGERVNAIRLVSNMNQEPKLMSSEEMRCLNVWNLKTGECLNTFCFKYDIKQFHVCLNSP